jgi:hypothetical protein
MFITTVRAILERGLLFLVLGGESQINQQNASETILAPAIVSSHYGIEDECFHAKESSC